MKLSTYLSGGARRHCPGKRSEDIATATSAADVMIRTSSGLRIPADSSVLASASPVFESVVERRRSKDGGLKKDIRIHGVPSDAVLVFVGLLHSPSCMPSLQVETMDKYGMHLMVLAHVYRVKWLKGLCEVELGLRLSVDSVVDVLQLARQCDVPRLYLQCMRLMRKEFAAVEKTEAWMFLQENDPWLELEILKFLEDEDMRQKRRRRKMEEQKAYLQLSEAMECLQVICTQGCAHVPCPLQCSPSAGDAPHAHKRGRLSQCPNSATCRVLRGLIRHLPTCRHANRASCRQCRRVWDLLRLHSLVCLRADDEHCRVPLCRQFKVRMQMDPQHQGKGEDGRWRMLAKKVLSVKVMASIAQARKQDSVN